MIDWEEFAWWNATPIAQIEKNCIQITTLVNYPLDTLVIGLLLGVILAYFYLKQKWYWKVIK